MRGNENTGPAVQNKVNRGTIVQDAINVEPSFPWSCSSAPKHHENRVLLYYYFNPCLNELLNVHVLGFFFIQWGFAISRYMWCTCLLVEENEGQHFEYKKEENDRGDMGNKGG